jgi:hypothetical protein
MSVYRVSRNGTDLGQFPESELLKGMTNGQFTREDWVWREGMGDWRPLFDQLSSASPPPLPSQAPPLFQTDRPRPSPASSAPAEPDFAMRMLMPVGRSGWAIAAGYLGLFSLVVLPAPLALIVSIIAIRDIRKSKKAGKRKHGMGRAIFGLVVGIAGTLLLIALIVAGRTAKGA